MTPFVIKNDEEVKHDRDKGQLISEWMYEFIAFPKYKRKIVRISALTTKGRNPDNFLLVFWEKQWLHNFILSVTDRYS